MPCCIEYKCTTFLCCASPCAFSDLLIDQMTSYNLNKCAFFLHFVRKHDLPFCCDLNLEHSRQRRLINKSILTFESIYTELNLVDIEITFAHTLVHISQKISNWSIIYTLNVILVTPGNNWPHLIGHLGATPPLQSLPACSLIHPSHRLSGTNTLISQHIVWFPNPLAAGLFQVRWKPCLAWTDAKSY